MSAIIQMASRNVLRRSLALNPNLFTRTLKTSQKKDETCATVANPPVSVDDFAKPSKKNWVSYGFDYKATTEDRLAMNLVFFSSITLCLVVGGFVWAYLPDTQLRDWAQREAYLELRRREEAGLDLVSPNYIAPEIMVLPDDEELGDTEIII